MENNTILKLMEIRMSGLGHESQQLTDLLDNHKDYFTPKALEEIRQRRDEVALEIAEFRKHYWETIRKQKIAEALEESTK